jgi:hypothetical protein
LTALSLIVVLFVPTPLSTPPTIGDIPDQQTDEDTPLGPIVFTVEDADVGDTLTVTGGASDPLLLPNANLLFGGGGITRTLALTPTANLSGSAIVTVTVSDGLDSASEAFTLTVNPVNDAPWVGALTTLYDGALDTGTPDTQGFVYQTLPALPYTATHTFADSVTTLTTTDAAGIYAGYFGSALFVPTLDRQTGFALQFTARVITETHAGSDKDGDGIEDRAGFSLVALSEDTLGIELGFWPDRVWAQEDGAAEPPAGALFTHAESGAFDTTAGLTGYELLILGEVYTLLAGDGVIVSGRLRDYTPFEGTIDPYETPNLIFLGDDTASASAVLQLASVHVAALGTLPDLTTDPNTPLGPIPFAVGDVDSGQALTLTAASSNPALVPGSNILFGGMGLTRTLTITPAFNQAGIAVITVTVSDGQAQGSAAFALTVNSAFGLYAPLIVR